MAPTWKKVLAEPLRGMFFSWAVAIEWIGAKWISSYCFLCKIGRRFRLCAPFSVKCDFSLCSVTPKMKIMAGPLILAKIGGGSHERIQQEDYGLGATSPLLFPLYPPFLRIPAGCDRSDRCDQDGRYGKHPPRFFFNNIYTHIHIYSIAAKIIKRHHRWI